MSNNIDIDQMRDIRVNHSELPYVSNKISIEVILVNENILILKDIADNKVYKIRTPYSETFNGVSLNPGDRAVFRLVKYGINDYRSRLDFHAYIESSEVETAGYDLSSVTTEDKRVRTYTVAHKTWHSWDEEKENGLKKVAEEGLTLDEIMQRVQKNPDLKFTRESVRTRLNKLGYSVIKGVPIKKVKRETDA